jgi:hypothetical protein
MALSGAVDLVSTDRNSPDRRRSERKTFPRNLLAATSYCLPYSGRPLFLGVTFSDFCKISVTSP